MSGLLLLASACHHLQANSSDPPLRDEDSPPPEGDTDPSWSPLCPPRSPWAILKLSDQRLLESYASHLFAGLFACRLCPPHVQPFYAERTPMQMHLLQDHVFNAINEEEAIAASEENNKVVYSSSSSEERSPRPARRRRRKIRRLSAEADRRNAMLIDCPYVNWREIRDLIKEPIEPLNYVQASKLGVALDHACYCKPVSEGEPPAPTSSSKKTPRKRGRKAALLVPKQETLDPSYVDPPMSSTLCVAAEVEISSTVVAAAAAVAAPVALPASNVYECPKCARVFKKKSNLLRHGTLFGCKVGAMQRRKQKLVTVKEEAPELTADFHHHLMAYESLLPSPDTEVAAISQRLEAEDAILNAKCPSGYVPKNGSAASSSPSTNSVFSSPEQPLPVQQQPLIPPTLKLEAASASSLDYDLPHFASGPPPKEARVTTPKKASTPTSPHIVQSPGISPSNFLAGGKDSSFSIPNKRRSLSSPMSAEEAPRPPKRRPAVSSMPNMRPFPVLSSCPDVVIRRPFLLAEEDVGSVGREEEVVEYSGGQQQITQMVMVDSGMTNSYNHGPSQIVVVSGSGATTSTTSKLEQVLRRGAANVKLESE